MEKTFANWRKIQFSQRKLQIARRVTKPQKFFLSKVFCCAILCAEEVQIGLKCGLSVVQYDNEALLYNISTT